MQTYCFRSKHNLRLSLWLLLRIIYCSFIRRQHWHCFCPLSRDYSKVGFNAGHSSLNWLLNSHPSTKILAFDLGEHDYVKYALGFLEVSVGFSCTARCTLRRHVRITLGDKSRLMPGK